MDYELNDKIVAYGKTPLGQLLYDLGFTKLSDRYLARKHHMPIAEIRSCREAAMRGLGKKRKIKRTR